MVSPCRRSRRVTADAAAGPARVRRRAPLELLSSPPDQASLAALIESQVIPRLLMAHPVRARATSAATTASGAPGIMPADIDAFTPLVLQVEADELVARVEALLDRGISVEALLLDLLVPIARRFGDYWEQDRFDFVDVTMGLWRLQEVVHELSARAPIEHGRETGRRALFASVPGDQHTFGTIVIEEVFARGGWVTDRMVQATTSLLVERVADEWFDLVGLTASCSGHTATMPSAIKAMRSVSRNPHLCVMVGGPVFLTDPQMAQRVGADATAPDARMALSVAETWLGARRREARYG